MFVYTLSSFLDKYDRYWYARLVALKLSCVTIGLFLLNAFLKSPFSPVLAMLVAGAGIFLIESPMINTQAKKDTVYLVYFIITIITIAIFNLISYFLLGFIIVACLWSYLLYKIFSRKLEIIDLVSLILLLGLMSIEGSTATDSYSLFNLILYFCEFALIAFWMHKFFPNLYLNVYKSAFIRLLENYLMIVERKQYTFDINMAIAKHMFAMRNVMPLLEHQSCFKSLQSILDVVEKFHSILREYDFKYDHDSAEICHILHEISLIVKKGNHPVSSEYVVYAQQSRLKEQLVILQMRWSQLCKIN